MIIYFFQVVLLVWIITHVVYMLPVMTSSVLTIAPVQYVQVDVSVVMEMCWMVDIV